jgi:hypothetical protein
MRFAGGTLMPVIRRRESAPAETAPSAKPGGKGRPTPKRSEAEKLRRQPITAPPKNRKEAYRKVRERQAEDRNAVRAGMARGEEKYLQKRDKGPVRRFARDYVDARRTFSPYVMWAMFGVVLLSLLPILIVKQVLLIAPPPLLAVSLLEAVTIGLRVRKLAAERFPDEEVRGVALYAILRAMQLRRMRIPNPQLRPGQKDQV